MAGTRPGPTRRTPLDGLKPTDFDKRWPNGVISLNPARLTEQGLTPAQVTAWREVVKHLQTLARRYVHYLTWRETSQATLARQWKVSANRLSAFRTGKGWPSGALVAMLECHLPSIEDMVVGTAKGDSHDDKKQAVLEAERESQEQERRRAEELGRQLLVLLDNVK